MAGCEEALSLFPPHLREASFRGVFLCICICGGYTRFAIATYITTTGMAHAK